MKYKVGDVIINVNVYGTITFVVLGIIDIIKERPFYIMLNSEFDEDVLYESKLFDDFYHNDKLYGESDEI